PLDADARKQIITGRTGLVELLFAVRSIVADGGSVHQHLRLSTRRARLARDSLHNVSRTLDATGAQQLFELGAPSFGKDVLARQMNHAVAIGNGVHPRFRPPRTTFEE